MNSNLLDNISRVDVTVTMTSVLNMEIFGVHIANRERMGILVSSHTKPLFFSDYGSVTPHDQTLVLSLLSCHQSSSLAYCSLLSPMLSALHDLQLTRSNTHRHNTPHGGTLGSQRILICLSALVFLLTLYQRLSPVFLGVSESQNLYSLRGVAQGFCS